MALTPELILSNLPTYIIFWTAMTLSWGIFLGVALELVRKVEILAHITCHTKRLYSAFIWSFNALLFLYLFLGPYFVSSFSDVVVVFNVFINVTYAFCTQHAFSWWKGHSRLLELFVR